MEMAIAQFIRLGYLHVSKRLANHHAMEDLAGNHEFSDDDEIDYSVKPEFYDPDLDDKDELWIEKKRNGRMSDAVLSCPACFTTLCLECQRHEKYVTQYRAIFVMNCEVLSKKAHVQSGASSKRAKRTSESAEHNVQPVGEETLKQVVCDVCSTEVGVMDEDEVYHFYNVLPSES